MPLNCCQDKTEQPRESAAPLLHPRLCSDRPPVGVCSSGRLVTELMTPPGLFTRDIDSGGGSDVLGDDVNDVSSDVDDSVHDIDAWQQQSE